MSDMAIFGDADPLDAINGDIDPRVVALWIELSRVWATHHDHWRLAATDWRDRFLNGAHNEHTIRDAIRRAEGLLTRGD